MKFLPVNGTVQNDCAQWRGRPSWGHGQTDSRREEQKLYTAKVGRVNLLNRPIPAVLRGGSTQQHPGPSAPEAAQKAAKPSHSFIRR